jgi:hypothetical protein
MRVDDQLSDASPLSRDPQKFDVHGLIYCR